MRRREFITLLGGAATGWPLAARAQQSGLMKRLGVLRGGTEVDLQATNTAFRQGLQDLGWTEGRNLRVDYRSLDVNGPDSASPYAAELVGLAPDVIFASPSPTVAALLRLTRTIPIVFTGSGDPVQAGSVQSFARPGGNVTGFISFDASINTKYLQLLKDIAPQVTRVAVIQTQGSAWRGDFAVVAAVARLFAAEPVATLIRDDAADIERAIVAFAREPNGGLIFPPAGIAGKHRRLIVALAATHRLPAVYSSRGFVDAGGLMSYGAEPLDYRRVASYVDRILKGEKPADLPVQAPTKFETVLNLKTAKALGLQVPDVVRLRADEVIE